jgi:hypothetical protein
VSALSPTASSGSLEIIGIVTSRFDLTFELRPPVEALPLAHFCT